MSVCVHYRYSLVNEFVSLPTCTSRHIASHREEVLLMTRVHVMEYRAILHIK